MAPAVSTTSRLERASGAQQPQTLGFTISNKAFELTITISRDDFPDAGSRHPPTNEREGNVAGVKS